MHSQSKTAITSTCMDYFQVFYLQFLLQRTYQVPLVSKPKFWRKKQNHFGYKMVGGKQDRIQHWVTPSSLLIGVESVSRLHLTAYFCVQKWTTSRKGRFSKNRQFLSRKVNIQQWHRLKGKWTTSREGRHIDVESICIMHLTTYFFYVQKWTASREGGFSINQQCYLKEIKH